MYQPIDQVKTGIKLKKMIDEAGYDVKYIQNYLQLSYPQSIYRWFKGIVLPSVENLCALSKLLDVHMEDLLVLQGEPETKEIIVFSDDPLIKRLIPYVKYFGKIA